MEGLEMSTGKELFNQAEQAYINLEFSRAAKLGLQSSVMLEHEGADSNSIGLSKLLTAKAYYQVNNYHDAIEEAEISIKYITDEEQLIKVVRLLGICHAKLLHTVEAWKFFDIMTKHSDRRIKMDGHSCKGILIGQCEILEPADLMKLTEADYLPDSASRDIMTATLKELEKALELADTNEELYRAYANLGFYQAFKCPSNAVIDLFMKSYRVAPEEARMKALLRLARAWVTCSNTPVKGIRIARAVLKELDPNTSLDAVSWFDLMESILRKLTTPNVTIEDLYLIWLAGEIEKKEGRREQAQELFIRLLNAFMERKMYFEAALVSDSLHRVWDGVNDSLCDVVEGFKDVIERMEISHHKPTISTDADHIRQHMI